jgi:hypothetical protein
MRRSDIEATYGGLVDRHVTPSYEPFTSFPPVFPDTPTSWVTLDHRSRQMQEVLL